jgi:ketosteroid isomerase-like protein
MPGQDRPSDEIERLEEKRRAATLAGDVAELSALLDDDLVYVHSTGNSDTKASYLEGLRSGHVAYEQLEMSDRRIVVKAATAAVFYTMRARVRIGTENRTLHTRILAVWAKSDGGWRLTALHSAAKS